MVMAKLPPGFRFCPTDEELIIEYLKPKVLGDNWCNFIQTVNLYGPKSPWQLFDVNNDKSWTDSPQSTLKEKYLYVFTKLSKLRCSESNKGSVRENKRKKAGCGTWKGETRKPIKDQKDNVIGEQRMLVFVINNVGDQFDLEKAGHFRMHEYSLSGVNKGLKSADGDDIVLCKITFSSSKQPVFKLDSKSTHSGPYLIKCGNGQDIEQSKNVEKSTVRDSLERTMNSISTSVDEINRDVAENIEANECLTAENLFVMDGGVGDSKDYLGAPDQFDDGSLELNESSWDDNFTDSFIAENLFVMDSGVGDSKDYLGAADQFDDGSLELNESSWDANFTDSFIAENLFVMDSGVGDSKDYLGAADQFDDGLLELNESGWDASFTCSFMALLNSEEGEVEDISQLGKRKIEEESFCRSKKMCF